MKLTGKDAKLLIDGKLVEDFKIERIDVDESEVRVDALIKPVESIKHIDVDIKIDTEPFGGKYDFAAIKKAIEDELAFDPSAMRTPKHPLFGSGPSIEVLTGLDLDKAAELFAEMRPAGCSDADFREHLKRKLAAINQTDSFADQLRNPLTLTPEEKKIKSEFIEALKAI